MAHPGAGEQALTSRLAARISALERELARRHEELDELRKTRGAPLPAQAAATGDLQPTSLGRHASQPEAARPAAEGKSEGLGGAAGAEAKVEMEKEEGGGEGEEEEEEEEEEAAAAGNELQQLVLIVRKSERMKERVQKKFLARQVTLVNGFERDAAALFQRFRDKQRPYDEAIAALWSPLQKALQDKYVLFEADKLDTMVLRSRRSPWQPQAMLAEGSFDFVRFVESVEGVRRREREQQEAARRRAAERERAERAAAEEDQLLERRAKEAVLPIMSNLSLEQAKRALARNGKDPQRTLDWLLSVDPQSLARALDEAPKSEARPVAQAPANYGLVEDPNVSHLDVMTRQESSGVAKIVALRVLNVSSDGVVKMRAVLDRNRIPCNPYSPQTISLPLHQLVTEGHMHVADEAECKRIEADRRERVPVITYLIAGDEFTPIKIEPQIRLSEYVMEWDDAKRTLRSMRHRVDGDVMFRAVQDDGDGLGRIDDVNSPIELFTQALDDAVHNIVHMHVDDMRDDVAIDTVNLTGSARTLQDCKQFDVDAAGRRLSYRVVVHDRRVVAVLYRFAKQVREASFVEHQLPPLGALVALAGGRLALLRGVPTGLVVNADGREVKAQALALGDKPMPCRRKHPVELPGFVEVEVVAAEGRLLERPLREAVVVCALRRATREDEDALAALRREDLENKATLLRDKLQQLERGVAEALSGARPPSILALDALRKEVFDLAALPELKDTFDRARIDRIVRELRSLAVANRSAPQHKT